MDERWDDLAVRREDKRLRALIADDDDGIRRLLTAIMELDGWEVRTANDGAEAVALTEEFHPDAVLLDVMMPNVDGVTALRQIRANEDNRDVTVVMVSANNDERLVAEAKEAGADEYFMKLDVGDIPARVKLMVQRPAETTEA